MPNATRDIAMQGRLSMDQFTNRLNAVKDNQLRTTMSGGAVPSGFAPSGVVSPKIKNPDSMSELREEKKWVVETAAAKREEVQQRKILRYGVVGVLFYMIFK